MSVTVVKGLHPQERVEEFVSRGWWTDETGDGLFRTRVAAHPDRLAIVDPANRQDLVGSAPRRLTWRDLDGEVTHLAARLLELGVTAGDVVGVQLPNTAELAEVYLAAWTIGAAVSPLAMQYREHEVVTMAGAAGMKVLVTAERFGDRAMAAEAVAAQARIPSLAAVLAYGAELTAASSVEGAVVVVPQAATDADRQAVEQHRERHPSDPNRLATICWTSGTESAPKGVMRAHYDWMLFSWCTVDAPRIVEDDVILNTFPIINMAGINGMLLPWLRTGATMVQHHPFDMTTFFAQIAQERVTYTLAPPALLWMLLNNEELLAKIDLSSVTRIGSGSAPLQPAMVHGWQERHGIGIINFFGSNEGICLLSSLEDFPDPDDRAQYFPRYGHHGTSWTGNAAEWTRIKLVDQSTGEEVTEPGRPGELFIGGPQLFAGYVGGARLADLLDDDGMLRTGDIFEIAGDDDQFLKYVDRSKDMVIRGGMNIAPAELEGLVAQHPAVAEVAIIGDPDEMLGERVAAVVALRPDSTLELDELVEFLRGHKIASYKLPERLEVRDALPRNPVGKLLKRELRQEVAR
ncbi:class I adenylate-forming enzyme family protein [Pimelobacter simplex]|uniref:class I adenylate-forming enzyme family protein n=1 Tax=Nocardioides simplex TaxID=2045 RepID=UPI00382D758D